MPRQGNSVAIFPLAQNRVLCIVLDCQEELLCNPLALAPLNEAYRWQNREVIKALFQ